MERLTHPRSSGIKTGHWSPNKKEELIERLAVYEDTGLTPQDIYSLKAGTILKALGKDWILRDDLMPENGSYVLVSFANFSMPHIGRYEEDEDGGAFYPGDEGYTYTSVGLFVNAWMPLPEPYKGVDDDEK